jgi:predicted NodU family carbamoyl transferase
MSFAPTLTEAAQRRMPAVTHYDGTSRPQTVTARQALPPAPSGLHLAGVEERGAMMGALLLAYAQAARSDPVLINTSFNTHGAPLINEAREGLRLLATESDLDYVLLENWLFSKETLKARQGQAGGVPVGL